MATSGDHARGRRQLVLDGEHSRLKVEYQLTRDIFFRYVGQYSAQVRDTLRDPRTGDQLIVNGTPQGRSTTTEFRNDLLFSYKPTPGTVLFFATARRSASPTLQLPPFSRTATASS